MTTPENFIPWEQIEPLLVDGMDGCRLAEALATKLGLPVEGYIFKLADERHDQPLAVRLRGGLCVEKFTKPMNFLLNAEPVR